MKLAIDTYMRPVLESLTRTGSAQTMASDRQGCRRTTFRQMRDRDRVARCQAKRTGLALSDLLGGRHHDRLSVAWTLASGDTAH